MDSFEVRFSGSGGQGLILSAKLLSAALMAEGYSVSQTQSYEPVSRGGLSRADLVVGKSRAAFPLCRSLDYLLILDGAAAQASNNLLRPETLVFVDMQRVPRPPSGEFTILHLPFCETARQLGNQRVANIVALSALVACTGICSAETLESIVRGGAPEKFARLNAEAFEAGRRLGMAEVRA